MSTEEANVKDKEKQHMNRPVGATVRLLVTVCALLPIALHAQPEVEIEFVSSFGTQGAAPGQFNSFGGVTVDNGGHIYITDNDNHRIQICDYQGNCEADGSSGSAPGQFMFPIGIALDQSGRIVVSDGRNFRIQVRDLQGSWSTFGSAGDGVGQFRIPGGVAIDAQNRIVIADENNQRVQACDDQGSCSVIADGFVTPRSVGFDSQGRLVISDRSTNRIYICVPDGACSYFGSTGSAPGQFRAPTEVWVDSKDRVFITDRDNNRFQICDLEGACVAYGEFGDGPGQFNQPVAVAVDSQNRIIIGDSENDQIQIFQAIFPNDAAFTINSGLTDAWFNPATPGQGFFITVFEDAGLMFLAWFTYDTERPAEGIEAQLGEPGHRWLTAQGPYTGDTANLTLFLTEGGVFDAAEPPATTDAQGAGSLTIEFADCTQGLVSYQIPSLDISGEIPIERIVGDNVAHCQELAGL